MSSAHHRTETHLPRWGGRWRRVFHDEDVGFRTQMLELAAGLTDVIALGRGDPDFPTPAHILEAAKSALDSGATHYTHPAGDLTLRQAIADHLRATTGSSTTQPPRCW